MKKTFAVLTCLVAAALVFAAGCEKAQTTSPDEGVKADTASKVTPLEMTTPGTVSSVVLNSSGKQAQISVEIATSDEERAKGLMFRESLAKNAGMWFVFPKNMQGEEGAFWMKDTKVPLDIIFVEGVVSEDGITKPGKVVHVIEGAAPESAEKLISPAPFHYVLEANAGTVKENGIKVGDTVEQRIGK